MSATDELTADMQTVFGADVAWAMGQIEAERDWDKSSPQKFVQKVDPTSGLRVWTVVVADPEAAVQRKVKILCDDEPVLPAPPHGMPFLPVEFVGLSVRPWLNDRGCKPGAGKRCGCRVELSVRARGVRAISPARPAPGAKQSGGQSDAA
jgi:hypothetical protein